MFQRLVVKIFFFRMMRILCYNYLKEMCTESITTLIQINNYCENSPRLMGQRTVNGLACHMAPPTSDVRHGQEFKTLDHKLNVRFYIKAEQM